MTDIMKSKLKEMLTLQCESSHELNKRNIWVTAWCSDCAGYNPNIKIHDSVEEAVQCIYDILVESYDDELDWAYNELSDDCTLVTFIEKTMTTLYNEGFYYDFY